MQFFIWYFILLNVPTIGQGWWIVLALLLIGWNNFDNSIFAIIALFHIIATIIGMAAVLTEGEE